MTGWLAFDIGCIECGEASAVIGVFPDEAAAVRACEEYGNVPGASWGRPEWHGQHRCEVFPLSAPNEEVAA